METRRLIIFLVFASSIMLIGGLPFYSYIIDSFCSKPVFKLCKIKAPGSDMPVYLLDMTIGFG
jgi:hypothetical protein